MKVVIFYGTDCNQNTAWIPWLKKELDCKGVECVVANLPTPENQNFENWSNLASKIAIGGATR